MTKTNFLLSFQSISIIWYKDRMENTASNFWIEYDKTPESRNSGAWRDGVD
jgi:hypothetical protein